MMRTLFRKLRARAEHFGRNESGNIALETLIIVPILFWAFFATFTIFDAYRQHSLNQKAAYTIGDLVSRQTPELNTAFLTGTQELFEDLVRTNNASSVRITSVQYDETNDRYLRHWSRSIGAKQEAGEQEVAGWANLLPIMPDDEYITVVETWTPYEAPFNVGIANHEIHNFIFTRPRYAPNIRWEGL